MIERKVDYKPVVVTAVTREGTLYGQYCSDGPALEQLMEKLRAEFASKPPLGGAYTPKKGVSADIFALFNHYFCRS